LIWRVLRHDVPASWLRKFLLLMLGGTMFAHHSQHFYGEVLTAVALFLGLVLIDRHPLKGATAIVVGVVNTPAAWLGAALAYVDRFLRQRRLIALLPIALAAILIGAEFLIRRGSVTAAGYENDHGSPTFMPYSGRPGFSYPCALGLLAQLLSFGKGILFFAPGLILLFSRTRALVPLPSVQRGALWVLAGLLLVYAKWWAWYGGVFWGPRFLLFAGFPASVYLATALDRSWEGLLHTVLVLGLTWLSLWVGASGALFGLRNSDLCWANDHQLEVLCHYVPEWSPLVRPFVDPHPLDGQRWVLATWFVLVAFTLTAPKLREFVSEARLRKRASPTF